MRTLSALLLAAGLAGCRSADRAAMPSFVPAGNKVATSPRPSEPEGFLGVIVAPQTVDITPQINGRLVSVEVQVGDHVQQDGVLARLDIRSAKQDVAMARAELATARAEHEQAVVDLAQADERLARRSSVVELRSQTVATVSGEELSSSKYQERAAQTKLDAAEAAVALKQARLEQMKLVVKEGVLRAPFDGVVMVRYVDAGATVRQSSPVVRLLESGTLRVRFAVPEDGDEPAVGSPVRVEVAGLIVAGVIEKVSPEVDAASRMIFAEASLASPPRNRLRSGQIAHVFVERALAGVP
jgi:RND family efflux transporter MFP subunit